MEVTYEKVILELRDDLSDFSQKRILDKIKECKKNFNVIQVNENIYCLDIDKINFNENSNLKFFYVVLEDYKEYLKKLEYHNYENDVFDVVV